jgi:hypothetical protein
MHPKLKYHKISNAANLKIDDKETITPKEATKRCLHVLSLPVKPMEHYILRNMKIDA